MHSSKAVELLLEVDNGESLIQITQWINRLSKSSLNLSICKALFVQTVFIVKSMDRKLKIWTQKPKMFCRFTNILETPQKEESLEQYFLQIYINKSWRKTFSLDAILEIVNYLYPSLFNSLWILLFFNYKAIKQTFCWCTFGDAGLMLWKYVFVMYNNNLRDLAH